MLGTIKVATTNHIAQVVFADHVPVTAQRLAQRHLQRLTRFGLVHRFDNVSQEHRRRGASGFVHGPTSAGLRLVGREPHRGQRKAWQPTPARIDHWLAITDLYVCLAVDARAGGPIIREFLVEGEAKRTFRDASLRQRFIYPDVLVRLLHDGLELSWFVEIDRGSEGLLPIAQKCRAYRAYELSGLEQAQHAVFPGVLFVVPDEHRARRLGGVIAAQPASARGLFQVARQSDALAALRTPT
ncbi:replication-relaxation family protein [Streptomyces spiramyceticus]|uniref:replication-relaxation family protein n=1 Tax=Streptomyces spiramyceticus TaxID=299717 RepID=UPI00237A3733|nr:replication-relaxation family protein [Streptomyces spiramyceticus]